MPITNFTKPTRTRNVTVREREQLLEEITANWDDILKADGTAILTLNDMVTVTSSTATVKVKKQDGTEANENLIDTFKNRFSARLSGKGGFNEWLNENLPHNGFEVKVTVKDFDLDARVLEDDEKAPTYRDVLKAEQKGLDTKTIDAKRLDDKTNDKVLMPYLEVTEVKK